MAQSRSEAILENMLGASNVVDPKTRLEKLLVQVGDKVDQAGSYGSPLQAATVAAMTDKTRVYVYTGTESGYTAGNWYYWNGTAWTSGGTYNAVAVDSALSSTSENPVQNKVINAGINSLKEDLTQIIEKTVPLVSKADMSDISTYYDNGYYDGAGDFVETTGYANYQIGSKSSPYQVYFASTSGGYVQMSVFSGTPSSATFVARYRTSDNSLPTSVSPLTIPAGYIVVIAIVTYTTTDFSVYLGFNADISFTSDRIDEIENIASSINKKRYVKRVSSAGENASTERLEIYLPMPVGYLCYYFVRSYVTEDKTDIWRISNIYKANDNCVVSDILSSNGEWECAIRLNGRDDFAGGYMHGDEVYTSLTLFLDGAVVDRTSLTALTPFETLEAVQYSNLYDPNDHTTVFAQHGSAHRWTNKLEILQDIAWVANESLDPSFLAMFPPLKTYTTKWYTDCDHYPRAISLPQQNSNYKNVRLYDTTSGFTADFGIEEYPNTDSDGYFLMTDNSGNPYNKCYYAVNGYGGSVQAGDIWKSKSIYIISLTA